MFRLIGFLFGVVAMIVALAVVVDAPTRERAGALSADLTTRMFDAVERLREKDDDEGSDSGAEPTSVQSTPAVFAKSAPLEDARSRVTALSGSIETSSDGPVDAEDTVALAEEPVANSVPLPKWQTGSAPEAFTAPVNTTHSNGEELNWEPIWWAFRSEFSAKGFAGYLNHLTGQEYRVRRTSQWSYQVEFPYIDEGHREAILDEIQSKTGLGLTKAMP